MNTSTKVVQLVTCPWPKCGYTWEPRGPTPPRFCASPTCKRPMSGPHARAEYQMAPSQRIKIAIGHLKKAEVITYDEAYTFLTRADIPDREAKVYLDDIGFSP